MTQQDKDLLLIDLCARVPYHPKGRVVNSQTGAMCEEWLTCATFQMFVNVTNNCRLYLRPMSSMTGEEKEEFRRIYELNGSEITEYATTDYLNSIYVDYRGLIEKGLAIAVTEENNPYK